MDLLKFLGVPESGGLRIWDWSWNTGTQPGGSMTPARGFPWKQRAHPTPLCPVLGSPFPSPTWKHQLELWGLHVLILGFCGVQELTKMDHLEKNKNTPSPLNLLIFPTDQELFLFILNSKPLGSLNSQIGSFLLSFSMEYWKHRDLRCNKNAQFIVIIRVLYWIPKIPWKCNLEEINGLNRLKFKIFRSFPDCASVKSSQSSLDLHPMFGFLIPVRNAGSSCLQGAAFNGF